MNPSSDITAILNLQALTRMLSELRKERVELFGFRYATREFGGFEIVLGREYEQFKFTWDDCEAILSVSFVPFPGKNAALWTHESNINIPNQAGLFEEIAAKTRYLLTREPPRESPRARPQRQASNNEKVLPAQIRVT